MRHWFLKLPTRFWMVAFSVMFIDALKFPTTPAVLLSVEFHACRTVYRISIVQKTKLKKDATFEVFTAMKIHVIVFWVVTPCSDVVGYNVSEGRTASIFRVK
jgi:hypothetical protein